MIDKTIDVNFEDVNKKYYTIDQVSKILKIELSSIAFYFEKLNDFLNITSVGMYQLFDDKDVENLKRIHTLDVDNHMSMKEIRKHLSQNKQEVLLKKESNNQVDQSVLNLFQQFANAMMNQNSKIDEIQKTNRELVTIINKLYSNQEQMQQALQEQKGVNEELLHQYNKNHTDVKEQFQDIKNEVAISKDNLNNITEKIISENKKDIESIKENNNEQFKKIENSFKCITQEEIRRYTEEQNQHQGFFSKLFKKK